MVLNNFVQSSVAFNKFNETCRELYSFMGNGSNTSELSNSPQNLQ